MRSAGQGLVLERTSEAKPPKPAGLMGCIDRWTGVCASSIGLLLQCSGLRVTSIKIDPYLNIDAGTMSPFEHGEVFVLDDGGTGPDPVIAAAQHSRGMMWMGTRGGRWCAKRLWWGVCRRWQGRPIWIWATMSAG